jgi:hypothetical protein
MSAPAGESHVGSAGKGGTGAVSPGLQADSSAALVTKGRVQQTAMTSPFGRYRRDLLRSDASRCIAAAPSLSLAAPLCRFAAPPRSM